MKRWLKRAYRHHAQSRELKRSIAILVRSESGCKVRCKAARLAALAPSARDRAGVRARRRARRAGRRGRGVASRQRNSSSAMLSAARTARRSESPVGVESAAARIFSSTYAASRATYSGSSELRIGYRCPWISTGMTRPSRQSSSVDAYRLSASSCSSISPTRVRMTSRSSLSADSSARERCRSRPAARASRRARAPAAGFLRRRAPARAFMPLDHADEQLQLLLEPIDRFELDAAGRCLRHSLIITRLSLTAPCSRDERRENRCRTLCCTSASVSVRSGA